MRSGALLFALPLVIAACASPIDEGPSERLGTAHQPIVNGTPSTAAQDATVMLTQNGKLACTATLIAPNLVLTARHCVSELDESSACGAAVSDSPATSFGIALGVNANGASAVAMGKRLFLTAGKDLCGADVALIQLDRDIPNAKLAALRFTPLAVGEMTLTVGYGDDGTGKTTPSRFQRTGVQVLAVGPAAHTYQPKSGQPLPVAVPAGDISTTESTCFGDSGGPLFDSQGRIVGVTSRGIDESCIDRPSLWTAVPQHEKLIKDAAIASGHPLNTAPPPAGAGVEDEEDPSTADDASEEEEEEEDEPPTKKKPKRRLSPAPAAGCMTAPSGSSSPTSFGLGLALLLGVAASRRSRRVDVA